MSRRWQTAAVVLGAGVLAIVVIVVLRPTDQGPTDPFCNLYPNIGKMTAMLERGLDGNPRPSDLEPSSYRTTTELVWSDAVAEGGPDDLDADAVRIATAVRAASGSSDASPLQTQKVRRAVDRVEAGAREACVGRDR